MEPAVKTPARRASETRSGASRLVTRLLLISTALVALSNRPAAAQSTTLPLLTQPVTDLAGVVDPESAREMDTLSRTLQAATGDAVVVVTVPTVEPYADIREYAVKLFENQGRGIGTKGQDNGVLILLAVKERRVWVEVGYALEQWITDGFAGSTSRQDMVPSFREGQYGRGLLNGMRRIVGRIAEGRNVTLTGVEIPRRSEPERRGGIPLWAIVLVFIAIMLLSRSAGGPGGGNTTRFGRRGGWSSGVGPFGGGFGGGYSGGGWGGSGGFGGGFGGFGGGRSGGGGGGAGW
jgi:uncharacterized protein